MCLINYRGSLNISDEYCKQLCGNVGDMDVKDCISAINNLIDLKLIDKDKISCMLINFLLILIIN